MRRGSTSSTAFFTSRMLRPSARPISGSFFVPKRSATIPSRISTSHSPSPNGISASFRVSTTDPTPALRTQVAGTAEAPCGGEGRGPGLRRMLLALTPPVAGESVGSGRDTQAQGEDGSSAGPRGPDAGALRRSLRSGGHMTGDTVLIATDGSASARLAVEVGLRLAREDGADVVFIHASPEISTELFDENAQTPDTPERIAETDPVLAHALHNP